MSTTRLTAASPECHLAQEPAAPRCGPRAHSARALSGAVALAVALASLPASAQAGAGTVQLVANTIHGTMTFSNTDPAARAILDQFGTGMPMVWATSTSPTGYSTFSLGHQTTTVPSSSVYALQTEASGGVGQVTYTVTLGERTGLGDYWFPVQGDLVLMPPDQQPTGVQVDFSETVTVHRMSFCSVCANASSCDAGKVASIVAGEITLPGSMTSAVPAGSIGYVYQSNLGANAGTQHGSILIKLGLSDGNTVNSMLPFDFTAAGDQVVDHCVELPSSSGGLGRIQTPYIVNGPTLTSLSAGSYGPYSNYRTAWLGQASSLSDPATWLTLPDLVPGSSWWVRTWGLVNHGTSQAEMNTSESYVNGISVAAGATVDAARTFAGVVQEPFVMNPAIISGSVRVYDPYVLTNPSAETSLDALLFGMDKLIVDPASPNQGDAFYGPSGGTHVSSLCSWTDTYNRTSFAGRYEPSAGALSSTYSMPMALVYDQPQHWDTPKLALYFASNKQVNGSDWQEIYYNGTSEGTNPATFRMGVLNLQPLDGNPLLLSAGQPTSQDLSFCTSEVTLQFVAPMNANGTSSKFVNPYVRLEGGFQGTDHEGQAANYSASGFSFGTPFVGANLPHNPLGNRTSSSAVGFALPQGSFTLSPSVTYIDDSGVSSGANYPTMSVTVGCGQRLSLVSGLAISLDAHTGCADGVATVSGSVQSGGAPVSRVWYTVNGGAEVTVCSGAAQCQTTFSAQVTLPALNNDVSVYATAEGVAGTAQVTDLFTSCACATGFIRDPSGVCVPACTGAPSPIAIDPTALSATWINVPNQTSYLQSTSAFTLDLGSGTYSFCQPYQGICFDFGIDQCGKLLLTPTVQAFAHGVGTSTLAIDGFPVTIDATALGAGRVRVVNEGERGPDGVQGLLNTAPIALTLLPGAHAFAENGSNNTFGFGITGAGTFTLGAAEQAYVSAAGTATLTVHGFQVTVDALALSALRVRITNEGDTDPLDGLQGLMNTGPFTRALIPGGYQFTELGRNNPFSFQVDGAGDVVVPPPATFTLATATPASPGVPAKVTVSGTPHKLCAIGPGATYQVSGEMPSAAPRDVASTLTLMTGSYQYTEDGGFGTTVTFDVLADGSLSTTAFEACSNHPPVADAGPDQTACTGAAVTLAGAGAGPDPRDVLSCSWTQLSGPGQEATFASSPGQSTNGAAETMIACGASFTPTSAGTLTFKLGVTDGAGTTGEDTVDVSVHAATPIPTAVATAVNAEVFETTLIELIGSKSFSPDGTPLTYAWTQLKANPTDPDCVLTGATTASASCTAPALSAGGSAQVLDLVFQLTVTNSPTDTTCGGPQTSPAATVTVRVSNVNHDPIAKAGQDQTRNTGALVTLDGTASSDPDGDALSYAWTQTAGPVVTLDAGAASPEFTAPPVPAHGQALLAFSLVVSDPYGGLSTASTVSVVVLSVDAPPACARAVALPAYLWPPNHKFVPVAIGGLSDPEGDPLTTKVTSVFSDEPTNGLGDGDQAPDALIGSDGSVQVRAERSGCRDGRVYTIAFTATDGSGGSCSGTVTTCVAHSADGRCGNQGPLYDATKATPRTLGDEESIRLDGTPSADGHDRRGHDRDGRERTCDRDDDHQGDGHDGASSHDDEHHSDHEHGDHSRCSHGAIKAERH